MNKHNFVFFALASTGKGISGGDRIFIELAREWSKKNIIEVFTTQEGIEMCDRQKLSGRHLEIKKIEKHILPSTFFLKYLYKICLGIKLGFSLKIEFLSAVNSYLYSSSDFWMDVFPAIILKIRYPKLEWVATWFMTAPNPLRGFSEGDRNNRYRLSAFFYWLSQLPVGFLIKKFADYVIVNNEDEKKRFPDMNKNGKAIVLLGAVRLDEIKRYQSLHKDKFKVYDAVFQGRFHPQKGVVELINIWRKVVDKIPNAKLAMIGDGPLRGDVELKIRNLKLEKNVKLFGYIFDGDGKYKIFSQSKIVVHPAFYDSGGMASAEAMAFSLPAVGFDLKAYESYYPEGMLKVATESAFAESIFKLLKNEKNRDRLGEKALAWVEKDCSWENRASQVYNYLTK
jgi:glycosyltransferase involved in cell wall biosynthesis